MQSKEKNIYSKLFILVLIGIIFLLVLAFKEIVKPSRYGYIQSFRIIDTTHGLDYYSNEDEICSFVELYFKTFVQEGYNDNEFENITSDQINPMDYPVKIYLNCKDGVEIAVYIESNGETTPTFDEKIENNLNRLLYRDTEAYYIPKKIKFYKDGDRKVFVLEDGNFGNFADIVNAL